MADHRHDEFMMLFLSAQDDLRAFIAAIVRDQGLEDELLQRTARVLWKSFDQYDPAQSFTAWARTMTATLIKDDQALRTRGSLPFSPEAIDAVARGFSAGDADGPWQHRETLLRECLEELPASSKRLITSRYGDTRGMEAIAGDFGLAPEAIYQALGRARKQLRDSLQKKLSATTR